jgi:hypothetical protein
LRVFLSYAHEDAKHRVRVKALAQRLQQAGMEVTLDQDRPAPDEGWLLWVEREVTAADAVLLVITQAFRDSFDASSMPWPGSGNWTEAFQFGIGTPASSSQWSSPAEDAVYRPGPLAHQTFYSVETEEEIGLLLRLLGGFAPQTVSPAVTSGESARPSLPLPPLDYYLVGVEARLSMHRRAWRYFSSRLEAIGVVLEEGELDAAGAQTLTGAGH